MKNTQWESNFTNHILNVSAVLPELTSIQKTGREIKMITSSNLCSRWTKSGGGNCTICPMADERDSERSRFHHPLNQTERMFCLNYAGRILFLHTWLSFARDMMMIEQWENKATANQFMATQQLTSEVLKYIYKKSSDS